MAPRTQGATTERLSDFRHCWRRDPAVSDEVRKTEARPAGRASGRERRRAEHVNDDRRVGIGALPRCLRYSPPHPIHRVAAASPVILLFAEINRRRNVHQGTFLSTGQFLLGYLTAWTGFSALATLAQWGLLTAALVSPMMESTSKALGGGLLLGAGLFQFSRLKYACLAHCRSPIWDFWRPNGGTALGAHSGWD
jgi:hypothetical protein